MRTSPPAVLLSVLVPLSVFVAPVASAPRAAPHAVTPEFRSHALRALEAATAEASTAPGARGRAWRAAGRPEVLATRTGVADFDLLGVTWAPQRVSSAPGDLTVRVRTHSGGGWTGWTELDITPTPGPREARTARPGTEPLWVGGADGYQVSIDVRRGTLPAGLRIDLVDPGSSAADDEVGARRPAQSAQAASAQPAVISRAQWGADESLRRAAPLYNATVRAGFVHHTAGANAYTAAQVPQILRAIYAYHVKGNGWSDIGYNFLVDRFGRLWEGRYGGMDRAVVGAHTGGFNVDTFGISAIGNFDKVAAPAPMVDSIARLMAWKLSLSHRNPNATTVLTSQGGGTSRYAAGRAITFGVVSAHRDAGNTSCPGANLYAQVPTIRALTATYLGTALLDPRPEPTSAVYGSRATITTVAGVTSDQQWSLEVREACTGTVVRVMSGTASPALPVSAPWDLRDTAGVPVRPGAYTLTLVSADASAAARTWVGQVSVLSPPTTPAATGPAALPGRTGFVPVDPIKVFDTRSEATFPLGPGAQVDIPVLGQGKVPADGVGAVALSIAAGCSTASTVVTAWPTGSARPAAPALNVTGGVPASALAVTALGGNGAVSIANATGTTELAVHVVGYYPVAGGDVYRPTRTLRLYDSRRDPAGILTPGADRVVTMPALAGVPAAAMTGAMLNVSTLSPAGTGTLTVQSGSGDRENATVSYARGSLVKSRAVARLQDGTLKLTAHTSATHVVVDVVGWWAPGAVGAGRLFQARSTRRVLDTRYGVGAARARVLSRAVLNVKVAGKGRPAPAGARAVVLNLTARDATRATFVTAWPTGTRRPSFPDLSVPAWRTTANLVVVRVGRKGQISFTNGSGSTHLVGDVVGYFP